MKHYILKIGGVFIIAAIAVFLFLRYLLPLPSALTAPPPASTKIFDRNGTLLYELLSPHQGRATFVPLDQISTHLKNATLAAEDARFYENSGIDWPGIFRAIVQNVSEQSVVSGASTITQQLVRHTIGQGKPRTVLQKIKEAAYAIRLTVVLSKEHILEQYLNRVYYGNHNYGIEAAAQGYFGKGARDLDLAEAAFLAGLPQSPRYYDPFLHFDVAKKRHERVLALMVKHEFIATEEAGAAAEEPLTLVDTNRHPVNAPHFVNVIIEELKQRLGDGIYDGVEVVTTLDFDLQRAIEERARVRVQELRDDGAHNAAVVVMDTVTGGILVMVGSVDFFDKAIEGEVNSAIALRPPGSTLKPFTYALAFEKGWSPATVIRDEPVRYTTVLGTPYLPKNFDFEFHGPVTIRHALANSYNIPALKTAEFVGVGALLERLQEAGLTTLSQTPEHYGLALTLGDGEVRLLDLVAAYSTFARGGEMIGHRMMTKVTQGRRVLFEAGAATTRKIFSDGVAFLITDILDDDEARIEEFGVKNALTLEWPASVKTGTTRNFKDAWTIGYSSDRIVGVWVGNNDGAPMNAVAGSVGAAPLWHDTMVMAHENRAPRSFLVPPSVEKRPVCEGKIPCAYSEWFLKEVKSKEAAEPVEAIEIVKPFDGDEFQLSSLVSGDAGALLFEGRTSLPGEIYWYVNGTALGKGKTIWWKPERGKIEIEARVYRKEETVIRKKIYIRIN